MPEPPRFGARRSLVALRLSLLAGAAYDVHPYLLINYTGNYESVSTIAHEWGHAMHTYLADRAQPYPTSQYPIFVAEIASTLDEALTSACTRRELS